ncbi:MAG: sigma-70 family RNA polymerase sigma factor [Bacteroidota bacterium]
MGENDFELTRRLQEGDRGALAELYDRYTPLLYPVLLRMTGDRAAADEALQETWVAAWREARAYDLNRGTIAAWLLALARVRALVRIPAGAGAPARRSPGDFDPQGAPGDDPEALPQHRQLSERVRRALGALEPKHRRVLECAAFEGLTQAEIAGRMNAPAPMVQAWTRQALVRLRELLPGEEWA